MDNDGADVVWVGFEGCNLLVRIVVVDPKLEVVGAAYNPVLACYEAARPNWHFSELKGLDNLLGKGERMSSDSDSVYTWVSNDQM
jgi:hypothetical protein